MKTFVIIYLSVIFLFCIVLIGSSIVVNIADNILKAKKSYLSSAEERRLIKYHGVKCLYSYKNNYYIYRDDKFTKIKKGTL